MAILYPKDTAEQAKLIHAQIDIFRQTLKALQISRPTAARLATGVQAMLRRRHGPELEVSVADLELPDTDTTALEEGLARPPVADLPVECLVQPAAAQSKPDDVARPNRPDPKEGAVPAK